MDFLAGLIGLVCRANIGGIPHLEYKGHTAVTLSYSALLIAAMAYLKQPGAAWIVPVALLAGLLFVAVFRASGNGSFQQYGVVDYSKNPIVTYLRWIKSEKLKWWAEGFVRYGGFTFIAAMILTGVCELIEGGPVFDPGYLAPSGFLVPVGYWFVWKIEKWLPYSLIGKLGGVPKLAPRKDSQGNLYHDEFPVHFGNAIAGFLVGYGMVASFLSVPTAAIGQLLDLAK